MDSRPEKPSPPVTDEARHQCLIYEGSPSAQLPALGAIIRRKLEAGYRCLYLNSRPMVAEMGSCLAALGSDVESEMTSGRLVLSSEPVTSANGDFDVQKMLDRLNQAIDQALKDGFRGLWATGDMTWEFGSEKNFIKLMEYEYRLDGLMVKRPELSGICQYQQDTLPPEAIRQARLLHPSLFISETLSRINPDYILRVLSDDPKAITAA